MLFETERFGITVGIVGEDKDPQYLVTNKTTGVVEFCNTSLYFVRDWAMQMTKALSVQDWEIANPGKNYEDYHKDEDPKGGNIVPFPGGGGGRTN